MKYRELTFGQVEALINKLGGPDIVKVILQLTPHYLNEYINLQALRTINEMWRKTTELRARVHYDDPAHKVIKAEDYISVDRTLTADNFPVYGRGEADVTYEYVVFDRTPSTKEVFQEIARRGLRCPDFAETREFHIQNPLEMDEGSIVSFMDKERSGGTSVTGVFASRYGLRLSHHYLDFKWDPSPRFLAVRKDDKVNE